jgi:hypothetical protein
MSTIKGQAVFENYQKTFKGNGVVHINFRHQINLNNRLATFVRLK